MSADPARGSDPKPGMAERTSESEPPAAQARTQLAAILLESVQALAEAGEVEPACRLAGRAYAALRHEDPPAARRFDVFLHRMIRKLDW